MRFWFGMFVGATLALLYAYRKQISDVINNRQTLSAGAKTLEGAQQAGEGLKELWKELNQ